MCFIYDGCGHHATMRQTLKANNIPLVFFSKDLHVTSACCVAYFSIQYVRLLCSYRRGRGARIERHAKAGFYSRMLRRFYWLPNCETLLRCGWTGLFLLEGRGENSATPWSYADYVTCWWNADFVFFSVRYNPRQKWSDQQVLFLNLQIWWPKSPFLLSALIENRSLNFPIVIPGNLIMLNRYLVGHPSIGLFNQVLQQSTISVP